MKPHFDKTHCGVSARSGIAIASMVILCSSVLYAQRHPWSLTASAGISVLSLGAVDDDNAADAQGWARQGYPVSEFPSLKQPMLYSMRVSYRHDREFSVSLLALYSSKTVEAFYHSPDAELDLARGAGSADIVLGVAYYPAARPYFLEWYVQATFGVTFTHATANAVGFRNVKIAGVPTPQPFVDTDAKFSKTKTSAGLGAGIDIPIMSRVAINVEALYRFAQVGAMNGTVTRFGERNDATTTVEFNYSGFLFSTGIRFEL
jgi:opacity protein-like surface antigen